MDNFNWLNSIVPLVNTSWHLDNVIRISDIENIRFYDEDGDSYKATIDPSHIKGIEYAYIYNCFNDITWIDLLNNLIRFKDIRKNMICFEDLDAHARNDYSEERLVFKYGDILITRHGQHRLALAKFLNLSEVKVKVIEYKFNKEKYEEFLGKKYFLDKFIGWNLITERQYEQNLQSVGDYLSISISGQYFLIHITLLTVIMNIYRKLNTSRIMVAIDKLLSFDIGNANHNRSITIENIRHTKYLKPYLRDIKLKT